VELLLKPQSQDILSERDLCHNTGHLSLTPSHPDTHDCYPLSSCGSVVLLVFPATCTHAPCYFKHDLWQVLLMFISTLWWLQFSQGGGLKHKWARCVRVPCTKACHPTWEKILHMIRVTSLDDLIALCVLDT